LAPAIQSVVASLSLYVAILPFYLFSMWHNRARYVQQFTNYTMSDICLCIFHLTLSTDYKIKKG